MLFSIIVPTFNAENSIRRCLDSILSQSFLDFEIIVINGGSTDNTGKILNEYANIHSCIKVFNFANSGVGISLAQGQYLIFVDSDDSINSNLLQEHMTFSQLMILLYIISLNWIILLLLILHFLLVTIIIDL